MAVSLAAVAVGLASAGVVVLEWMEVVWMQKS